MDEKFSVDVRPIEEMLERLSARAVFGEPIREGDAILIPVANVAYGFGYGVGSGRGVADEGEPEARPVEGGGSGGGGGGRARPQGYIRVDAKGARYEPMVDPTRISLAGILMIMWSVFWIAQTVRAFARR